MIELAGAEMGFEHGGRRLLQLQEERRTVSCLEQGNETTRPDAANADDFASDVDQREPVEQQPMFE